MQASPNRKIVSVNVSLPREIEWKGRVVTTGIFKEPVQGRIPLHKLNLDGDRQADLSVHGGPDKAIYAYPAEYYAYWRQELPDMTLNWGMFGENLTIEGFLDAEVYIGDRFRAGTAELLVTQPRVPCYKIGLKFQREDMVKRFLKSGYTGFYFRVEKEGEVGADDKLELLSQDENRVSISEIIRLYAYDRNDLEALGRAVKVDALASVWKDFFLDKLNQS